ncbi:unnamed protein product [Musa acuminata subsp. malaccensis]|uniref:(wild Malaysian banana) hypothetical protein n=1 Tax=Musa acuminata subsp. malaccensis TaxID=214687 RepID=A0A804L4F4_MUSAM|nr:unnamed protein product [Musa acuminata subsp. malaccensis]
MGFGHDAIHCFLLAETKNVPTEETMLLWEKHWFWNKSIADEDVHVGNVDIGKSKV